MTFTDRMADLVEAWWDRTPDPLTLGHRELMRMVATAVALRILRPGAVASRRVGTALTFAERLTALQDPGGLFSSDGNLQSPPDSAFTLNDLGSTLTLLERAAEPELAPLEQQLRGIAQRALPALVAGGVHTPNHRWEISAALVRLRAFDERAIARAEQWLAEGVDADRDGLYSERSANYAAFVSNPSLQALAEGLHRPDLLAAVHDNLHSQLALTDADGVVETVFSRRQDQGRQIPLECFHTQLRRFALRGCATCLAGAVRSEPQAEAIAAIALLEVLAEPQLGAPLPAPPAPSAPQNSEQVRHFADVGLLVAEHGPERLVVYGGSDVPHVGRVGSGLAGDPTFLRFRSGAAVVRSLRLSRVFFGLGPFRAESLQVADDGVARLHERVTASYYQPMAEGQRSADGRYRLVDDGRFTASMAFDERTRDDVELVTDVVVHTGSAGVELQVTTSGARTRWSLELALGDGALTGVEQVATDVYRMAGHAAELRSGDDAVVIETSVDPEPDVVGTYAPGEAFSFLGGTDALSGPRLYLTGATPGVWTLTLRPA
ncbi:hypothetical protein C8K30_101693 [Promicromonospora sp. AC04]|uniref:hypothetical protein n=1 Tax=Promicromonospora sp. AC04 TaxID=2135723 RepID=UPI000D37C174|nr:hypothetical protein [Promicromonospora sp. AC04]PUB32172.1 hypothetical protein C8K30_101693 [Promicromonospora sp. AC04]